MHRKAQIFRLLVWCIFTLEYSTASYNVYNYDLNTPLFTPDGLLKQVEYASEASSHSEPLVILPFQIEHHHNNNSNNNSSSHLPPHNHHEFFLIMATRFQSQKAQSRILPMPIAHNQPPPVVAPSAHRCLLLGINGILPDCVALLQSAKDEIQRIQSTYGAPNLSATTSKISSPSSTRLPWTGIQYAKRIAHVIGDQCQHHSFGGGIRPFGAEIIVCGMDPIKQGVKGVPVAVFVTQPSGTVVEYTREHLERGQGVIGGNAKKRERLKNLLREKMEMFAQQQQQQEEADENCSDSAAFIRERIKMVVEVMVSVCGDKNKTEEGTENVSHWNEIDLVMAHSSQGIFRFSGDMLRTIMER